MRSFQSRDLRERSAPGAKTLTNMKRYPVIIEPTSTGYSAYAPDVSGCVSAGDTVEGTRLNFHDALISHFEARRKVGEPIPEPRVVVVYVEIAA